MHVQVRTWTNVFVCSSSKFLLYVPSSSAGVSIPYPSISLHAIQRLLLPGAGEAAEVQGLYMQIATPSAPGSIQEDEEEECITLTIVPPADAADSTSTDQLPESDKPETPTQMLYGAVSACSNLHPDPGVEDDDDDEEGGESSLLSAGLVGAGSTDGGLPPPVDGSSGWITAENMHEFFDPEGNWIGGGQEPTLPLGPGAGTVRERDGEEGGEGENGTGEGEESEETKWRRTD